MNVPEFNSDAKICIRYESRNRTKKRGMTIKKVFTTVHGITYSDVIYRFNLGFSGGKKFRIYESADYFREDISLLYLELENFSERKKSLTARRYPGKPFMIE